MIFGLFKFENANIQFLTIGPLQILEEKPIHTLSINGVGTLRGAPLASLAHMGLGPVPTQKEWDQVSMLKNFFVIDAPLK